MGETTICTECKFLNKIGDYWYYHLCTAVQPKKEIDVITGKKGYKHTNSAGDIYYTPRPDVQCRDINDGNCKYYKPKGN